MGKKKATLIGDIFSYVYLFLFAVIILYPLLITVLSAFNPGNVIAFTLDLTRTWTLDNFRRLFGETFYGRWYINTLKVAVCTMALQLVLIVFSGFAYSRYRFYGKKTSLKFFLIIQMVPTTAALTAFYVMALISGGLDHQWFIILLYAGGGVPMNTWLMKQYFDTVPLALDESAMIDGAGHFRRFWQIILPLVRPMIAIQALWAFMSPWGEYMTARFILRSGENITVAIGLQQFISNPREQRVTLFAAGAVLIAIPISLLFFYLQRDFVSGLMEGGTKG
ncbi:sugar ABC transporter permease [Globicatella sp. PHS-GS-PNBC-21-1553]|uniref:sugar ABC transporter permease n=1 Tax=Globicatella sp. PHS-GS-PNBC-21-1553 TaxID=2885764 RepID=UPI00298EDEAA|nr:sugar ABC transporter permease [Globicatella sp. PHS-GS-PNBC-21-1553]WPC07869.1 sugar ABC transporter permease [Globicatella sp. PHS-GS-PNBC-21-1553]